MQAMLLEKIGSPLVLRDVAIPTPEKGQVRIKVSACAICRTDTPGRQWFVDHCHTVNRVRGILCGHCNSVLGYAKDDPAILKSAIKYLGRGLLLAPGPTGSD